MKKITQKNISDFYKGKNVAKNIIDLIQKKENSNKDINDFIDNNSFSSASLGNITNQLATTPYIEILLCLLI